MPSSPRHQQNRGRNQNRSNCFERCANFPRFSAILIILVYVFISGLISGAIEYLASSVIFTRLRVNHSNSLLFMYGSYCISILGLLLYPVFGFVADVCCGRYWMVVTSVCVMTLGVLLATILAPIHVAYWDGHGGHIDPLIVVMVAITYLLGVVGVAGFEANVVQFGLDQLMDHSSRCLSFYLHLFIWLRQLGTAVIILPLTLQDCDAFTNTSRFKGDFRFMPLAVFALLMVPLLVFLIVKRNTFYRELGSINPYRMVVKILGYALKNRYPRQRRSAFFYYYGLNPGRLDFAKVHYGGPYETEDVENVKTLLQILRVLICVGPVFILKMSASYFMYQHFVHHLVSPKLVRESCYTFWPLMGSGNQKNIITVVLFPVYIFVVFKVLKNVPRIFLRLLIGLVMVTICLVCVLTVEVIGHYTYMHDPSTSNRTLQCALVMTNQTDNSLGMHWVSLVVPNLLYGLASPIVYTTVFEFISAQSPKSMTGLLVGTFFFVNGFFQLIGTLLVVPFSLGKFWHSPVTGESTSKGFSGQEPVAASNLTSAQDIFPLYSIACEMWYLAIVIVFGILGVTMYSVAAWKYEYRKREETPFPQSDIEEIVSRDIEQDTRNMLDVASVEGGGAGRRRMVYST